MAKEETDVEQKINISDEYRELYSDRLNAVKQAHTSLDPMIGVKNSIPLQNLEYLHDVKLKVMVEFGRARMTLGEVLNLRKNNVIKVDKSLGEPVDVVAGGQLIARGEIVIVNDRLGIRITEIVRPTEKITTSN